MSRTTIWLVATLVTACGSAAGGARAAPEPQHTQNISVDLPLSVVSFVRQNDVSTATISAPRDRVWTNLVAVQEELGMRAVELNAPAGIAAYQVQNKPVLDGKRMSAYVDCGYTVTGPRTETHSITIRVDETLQSRGADTTVLHTTLNAFARNLGVSSDALRCSSTGRLEQLIARRLATRLQ